MPATYSHRYTSEQIYGRSTWKPPEPPPKPKPKQYVVLGMEVDYNTHWEYNHEKSWPIDGDVLSGVSCTLGMLEKYATDEHAKAHPIEAANARKILDQIREEITIITRKDDKNMKTPRTAADFIDALNDIYTESRNAYELLQDKVDKAAAKMEQAREELHSYACNDKQMAKLQYELAKKEYEVADGGRQGEYRKMVIGHEKRVAELRDRFAEHLEAHYAASPDKLDTATMQLLGTGICTPAELLRLVERHQGNPTMLRIVGEYARKLQADNRINMNHEDNAICIQVVNAGLYAKDGRRELRIFDEAVTTAAYGLAKESARASRMATHIPELMEGYKSKMNNLHVIPGEMVPATDLGTDAQAEE